MIERINRMDQNGRCIKCGERHLVCTTEQKGNEWIWKKSCSSCNDVKETQVSLMS
jgi:transcription elongation factor Elf1